MSLAIPVPFATRRRHRDHELVQEAALPVAEELPAAIAIRDVGEERAVRDAWFHCGHQVLRALNNKGNPDYVTNEYHRTKQAIIHRQQRLETAVSTAYEIRDRTVIMAMARFSMQPPYEHPLVEMDRQLAGAMLQEQQSPVRTDMLEHATM